jgi:lipoic acid synthetase
MILGNICTRSCGFCGVKTGRTESVDWDEPEKVARSIKIMKIKILKSKLIYFSIGKNIN